MKTLVKILVLGMLSMLLTIAAMAKDNGHVTMSTAKVEITKSGEAVIVIPKIKKGNFVIDLNNNKSGSNAKRRIREEKYYC